MGKCPKGKGTTEMFVSETRNGAKCRKEAGQAQWDTLSVRGVAG